MRKSARNVPFPSSHYLKSFVLLLCCFGILSCKPDVPDGELKLVVGPSTAIALPVPLNTCKQGASDSPSLSAPSYEFTKFTYSWQGDKDFTMSYIQVTLKSGFLQGGVDTSCTLAGADLLATLGSAPRQISAGDKTVQVAGCSIRCGSMKLNDGVNSAYITGTIKVIGIETDTDGNSSPVVGESDIAIQYTKIQ